jgi:uncharacterized membrane protein
MGEHVAEALTDQGQLQSNGKVIMEDQPSGELAREHGAGVVASPSRAATLSHVRGALSSLGEVEVMLVLIVIISVIIIIIIILLPPGWSVIMSFFLLLMSPRLDASIVAASSRRRRWSLSRDVAEAFLDLQ